MFVWGFFMWRCMFLSPSHSLTHSRSLSSRLSPLVCGVQVSAKTKQWVANLKMNEGLRAFDFSSDGQSVLTAGGARSLPFFSRTSTQHADSISHPGDVVTVMS